MNFLRKISKFKINEAYKTGIFFSSHLLKEKEKINAEYYVNNLLPGLIGDCQVLAPNNNFIFQQDGAPAHTSRLAQEWLQENSPYFITKDEWPPNSPDLNPLDFHVWGAMMRNIKKAYIPKP